MVYKTGYWYLYIIHFERKISRFLLTDSEPVIIFVFEMNLRIPWSLEKCFLGWTLVMKVISTFSFYVYDWSSKYVFYCSNINKNWELKKIKDEDGDQKSFCGI